MTKEEAKERFGDNIINRLLSLGADPTNVCRNDGIVEWCSDGCIKVGDIEVWAYYYFGDGEDVDRCDWEDRMEIEAVECLCRNQRKRGRFGHGLSPGCIMAAWYTTGRLLGFMIEI